MSINNIKVEVTIVVPKRDPAAINIWERLLENDYFRGDYISYKEHTKIFYSKDMPSKIGAIMVDKDGVEINNLDTIIDSNLFIFASRHSSASGQPALLIHGTGNWTKPTLGGNEYELSYTSALAIQIGMSKLEVKRDEYNLNEYKTGIEVTHHGPTNIKRPICFMELGSDKYHWEDKKGALAVGEAIMETAKEFIRLKGKTKNKLIGIGFGGNHYAYRFQKEIADGTALIGHIAPKYVIDELPSRMIKEAFEKVIEKAEVAFIDKKGTRSEQRKKIKTIVSELNKQYIEL